MQKWLITHGAHLKATGAKHVSERHSAKNNGKAVMEWTQLLWPYIVNILVNYYNGTTYGNNQPLDELHSKPTRLLSPIKHSG